MDNINWQSKYRDEIQKALDSAPKDWHKRERVVTIQVESYGTATMPPIPTNFDNKIAQFIAEEEEIQEKS